MKRRSWFEPQGDGARELEPSQDEPRVIPRTLAGWPEGSVYTPRIPVVFPSVTLQPDELAYPKQHRGRTARGA